MKRRAFTLNELLVVGAILLILGSVIFGGCLTCGSGGAIVAGWESTATITVGDKYVAEGVRYVEGEDETFQVLDSNGHWNAADVYRELKSGGTYTVRLRGFREGMWSRIRNIIEITEVIREPGGGE